MKAPTDDIQRSRTRGSSNDLKIMDRPRVKMSATAPPGTSSLPYTPQPPRRAISVRLGQSNTLKGRTTQQENAVTAPLVVNGFFDGEQVGPHKQLPQPTRPLLGEQSENSELTRDAQLASSFSQKSRVKIALNDKNLGQLNTKIVDFESRGLLSSPTSMLNTPREQYSIPVKHSTTQDPSSPHSIDARRSIMSSLSRTSSSPVHPATQSRYAPIHNGGTRKTRPTGRQRIYVPGVIRLEEHHAMLRKDSVATLDPFDEAIEPRVKRFSDMIVLDSIIVYFKELGVIEDATERCLDRYWRDTEHPPRHVADSRKSSVTSIEEAPQKSFGKPQDRWSSHGSRFSFSSASSTASLPPIGTPMRQRDRLRRLLSPAFPGSAFLKPSVDWGQQVENS